MDTKKFTMLIAALTAAVCVLTVVYNFASMPAYGGGTVSAVPLFVQTPVLSSSVGAIPAQSQTDGTAPDAGTPPASSASSKGTASEKPTADSHAGAEKDGSSVVNINTASLAQLESIPYIGPAKAQAILDYRGAHGAFASVDALDGVKGIGPATIDKIRSYITVK